MKDPLDRTKVVLRHLPPAISQSALSDQIDSRFAGRYRWFSFRPGKTSQSHQLYSRAYIDFNGREDVVEFAEFFDGRIFVNEKGSQFKCTVEYAPSQRVPKPSSKKDGREGTISKDPEYLEFLEHLAKPVENLPSAEIQLERREAERGAVKESPIVTPLMDFVRQKRSVKSGSQRSSSNGKLSRKAAGASPGNARSASTKRGPEKRKVSTSMYVLRDSMKNASGKDKAAYILASRREDQQLSDKSISVVATTGLEKIDDHGALNSNGPSGGEAEVVALGKKKILLLKGKEQGTTLMSRVVSQQQSETSPAKNLPGSASKQNQQREASARIIRSILSHKEARQGQQSVASQAVQQTESLDLEDKRTTRATTTRPVSKDHFSSDLKKTPDDKVFGNGHNASGHISEKKEKRTRNKDRPDRGFWTPLRRSDILHASDECLSSSSYIKLHSESSEEKTIAHDMVSSGVDVMEDNKFCNKPSFPGEKSQTLDITTNGTHLGSSGTSPSSHDVPLCHMEVKVDAPNASRGGQIKSHGSARSNFSLIENGSHRHGRRGPLHGGKDVDSFLAPVEGKSSKRGATGHGSHEKQVWVQKSGSGS